MPQFITCLPNDKNSAGESPPSIVTDDAARIEAFRARYDRPGYGVFYCINPIKRGATRRSRETIECIARLHLDIDFKDVVETPAEIDRKIDNLPLQPTDIFDSGGGRHLRYELKEPVFLDEDPELFDKVCGLIKSLTAALSADPAPAFPHALLRLPGSHNTKRGEPVLVKRTGGTGNPTDISLVDLLSAQPFLTPKPKTNGNAEDRTVPLDVGRLLEHMEHRGTSGIHMGQVRSTASMLRGGMSVDEAVRQVLEATERKGDPSWDWELEERTIRKQCYDFICKNPELAHALPDELREAFHAAVAKGCSSVKIVCPSHTKKWQVRGWGGQKEPKDGEAAPLMGGFVLYDANNLEPAEWIIKEMLPASGVLILPGQWGTYKTTTLLDMSYCIMTGTPFAGKYPIKRPGAVMLYALEGFKAVDRRLRAIAEFAGNGNAPLP
jgi:AAA domain